MHGPGRGVSARLAEAAGECLGAGSRTAPVHLYLELRPPRNAGHYVPAGENHAPGVFRWHHPVHEVLRRTDGQRTWKTAVCPEIVLEHYPDPEEKPGGVSAAAGTVRPGGSGGRPERPLSGAGVYVPRTVRGGHPGAEAPPGNARSRVAAGAVRLHALSLPVLSVYGRQAAGHGVGAAGHRRGTELREPWVQAQEAAYAAEDWEGVVYYGRRAVDITERSGFYINEDRAWGRLSLGRHGVCLLPDRGSAGGRSIRRAGAAGGTGQPAAAGEHALLCGKQGRRIR